MAYKDAEDQRRYHQQYYQANKAAYIARAKARYPAQRAKLIEEIRTAKAVPCTDCGVQYPHYVMQFDHLGEKNFNIADYARHYGSMERLRAEIALCEVVCANCHAERTYQRLQTSALTN